MTTASVPPTAGAIEGVRPEFARRTALVAGVFYLITIAASIPAVILLGPVLNDSHYVVGAGADSRVLWGCLLDVVNALARIGTAVTLFPVVKPTERGHRAGMRSRSRARSGHHPDRRREPAGPGEPAAGIGRHRRRELG